MMCAVRFYATCQMSGTNLLVKEFEQQDPAYADQVFIATTK